MAGVIGDVSTVCGSIRTITSTIDNFREGWITAPGEYQSQVDILTGRLGTYERLAALYRQPVDGPLVKTLKSVESKLKRVKERLQKLDANTSNNQWCSPICWLYAKVSLTLFPENLEKIFKDVNQDLDNIPKILGDEKEVSGLLGEASKNQAVSTTILNNDSKYVPIAKSQNEVVEAIEDPDGRPMILLYGGFGKGKSTLARYICQRYGKFGERSNLFDHVIVVSCGNSSISDLSTKQYEILEHLSPTSLTDDLLKSEIAKSAIPVGSQYRIQIAFENFLIDKKVLIILDDVKDARFLYQMWKVAKVGKDDKILITSQKFNLCADIKDDSRLIRMETPTTEEARKILASLVGLERKEIPPALQRIADKVIEATDKNPLALACFASTFGYNQDKTNKRDWQDAWRELSKQLKIEETAIVLGQNDEVASRSLWETMKLCIDSLETKDAKCTLFLMYACRGESVPEEVLRILMAGMKMSSSAFNRSRDELCMRDLLKPMDQTDEELLESRAWSLQSLVKLYMQQTYLVDKKEITGTIGILLGDEDFTLESQIKCEVDYAAEIMETTTEIEQSEKMRVVIALCALYFDSSHGDQAISRAVARAAKISNLDDSEDTINSLRRKAIEPLIWLLDKPEEPEEKWSERNKCSVRKILLKYLCERQLDDENVVSLLNFHACPSAQLATLMSLNRISDIEEAPLFSENAISLLQAVVDLLVSNEGELTGVKKAASKALRSISCKAQRDIWSTSVRPNMSGVLEELLQSLAILLSKPNAFATDAMVTVCFLAGWSKEPSSVQTILNQEGLLDSLVIFLHEKDKRNLHRAATLALSSLAIHGNDSLRLKITNQEGALVRLVDCLSQQDMPELQESAALCLAALARSEELRLGIANHEGALVGLVNCLSREDNPDLQKRVAYCLGNLACCEELRWKIANQEGALVGLVNCLSQQDKPRLQASVAFCLATLARSEELRLRIANHDGTLVGLVYCLSQHDQPDLQKYAANCLGQLACSEELRLRIANQEGALVGLVCCLSEQDKPNLQENAAWCLGQLACSEELRLRIADQEGALVGLVNCLLQEGNPDVQNWAANLALNLSYDRHVLVMLKGTEGFLEGLRSILVDGVRPATERAAARALMQIYPTEAQQTKLHSAAAFGGRAGICISMGLDAEALADLDQAIELEGSADGTTLRLRAFVKVKLRNYGGALNDVNETLNMSSRIEDMAFALQERGVLKKIMGDLECALRDLDEGLKLETDDYERLKHRGHVKFLLNDEEGARADAKWALRIRPSRVDKRDYGSDPCLGTQSVEFLGYKLK